MWKTATLIAHGLALISPLCGPVSAQAQEGREGNCGATAGGTVRGVVVNDSTRVPVAGSYIYLFVRGNCGTRTDALGRFTVHDVPSGTQRIETGGPGYRQFRPINVEVIAGDTTGIELRLVPGGPLEDCRALPNCAPLIDGGSGAIQDEDASLQLVAMGTAIGLAWSIVGGNEPWYACLPDEPRPVFAGLSERYSPVASSEECELPRDSSGRSARQMRHIATNRPAFQPRIDRVLELTSGRRTVSLSYYVGPLWAAGWDCDFERAERGWRATICVATWVS
jgi:hypothetical protein